MKDSQHPKKDGVGAKRVQAQGNARASSIQKTTKDATSTLNSSLP